MHGYHMMQLKTRMLLALFVGSLCLICSDGNAAPRCTLENAEQRVTAFVLKTNADNASRQRPILNELSALNSRAKNEHLPIGAQLAPDEVRKFEDLSNKLLDLTLRTLFNGELMRDARVLAAIARISEKASRGIEIESSDPDFAYVTLKMVAWATVPITTIEMVSKDGECSIIAGLEEMQLESLSSIDGNTLKIMADRAKYLQEKYQTRKTPGWISDIPAGAERDEAIRLDGILSQKKAIYAHIEFLERVKIIQRMSDRQYSLLLEALNKAKTRQDIENVQNVFQNVASAANPAEQEATKVLRFISQQFPSLEAQFQARMNEGLGLHP